MAIIKTKRSLGHNILVGAISGAIPISIWGAASGEAPMNDGTLTGAFHDMLMPTPAEGAVMGFIAGSVGGAVTGALTTAFTKRTRFTINGSLEEWQLQKKTIDLLPASQ